MARNGLSYSPGRRFGLLVLVEHVKEPTRKHWLMQCDCGREVTRDIGNATRRKSPSCGHQPCNPRGKTEGVSYAGAHYRIYAARGPASEHACVGCGGNAREWAYDHSDVEPLFAETGAPYSLDVSKYQPMCCSCHTLHDLNAKAV